MKILYGIQSLGNGHMSRARILVPELRKAGFDIDFIFSGRDEKAFFDMELFGDNYRCLPGFSMSYSRGKVKDIDTFMKNKHFKFTHDIATLDLKPYDFVLTDCEPVTAWAARFKRKKAVSISNQLSFKYNIPKYPGYLPSKVLINNLAPANVEIGMHFHHFNQPLLPPMIEQPIQGQALDKHILVYMYFEEVDDIVAFLKPFSNYTFSVFANVEKTLDYGHIQVKPFSYQGFNDDFTKAHGVICNAGFELSSKCLATSKRLLVKPLQGQVEQLSNALALQKLHRATVIRDLDQSVLERWLDGPGHIPVIYPNVAKRFAHWLYHEDWKTVASLSRELWGNTQSLPAYTADKNRWLDFNTVV